MKTSEIKISEYYGNLKKIVEQLEKCGYEYEASVLTNNVGFIALKRMAEDSEIEHKCYTCNFKDNYSYHHPCNVCHKFNMWESISI